MTLKQELINYGREHGWVQHLDSLDWDESLMLVRVPQPDEPRGKPQMSLWIEFDFDTRSRVVYAETIIGKTQLRLTGGKQTIRQTIRKEGRRT